MVKRSPQYLTHICDARQKLHTHTHTNSTAMCTYMYMYTQANSMPKDVQLYLTVTSSNTEAALHNVYM